MTLHTAIERSDEDDGKYSTDAAITFDNLLMGATIEDQGHSRSSERAQPPSSDATVSETHPNTKAPDTERTERADSSDLTLTKQKAMANTVATHHADHGADETYAVNRTTAIGIEMTHSFHKTRIEGETYYYLLQKTPQGGTPLIDTWVIVDVGTDWTYRIPDPDPEVLQEAIATAREQDWRAGKEDTVDYLTDDQFEVIQQEYHNLLETRLANLDATTINEREPRTSVFGEYVVADVSEVVLEARLRNDLSERQLAVVKETLPSAVQSNLDTTNWGQRGVTVDGAECPLLAKLTCEV